VSVPAVSAAAMLLGARPLSVFAGTPGDFFDGVHLQAPAMQRLLAWILGHAALRAHRSSYRIGHGLATYDDRAPTAAQTTTLKNRPSPPPTISAVS